MCKLITLDSTPSTNGWLREHIAELSHGTAITAIEQTDGRGRRGNVWLGNGGMLPLSVLLKGVPHPETVTLCAAVAVCRVLERECGCSCGIKWPNDIIICERKVCGILCESVWKGDSISVVVGVGVNLTQPQDYFETAGIPYGGSLEMFAKAPDREHITLSLAEALREYCMMSFEELSAEYRERCLTLGRQVRIIGANGERTAFATDLDDGGRLVCEDKTERFVVNSGEVSVRGLLGYI